MVNWETACILVTGGGAGIGKECTLHFLAKGSSVTALDASESALQQLKAESSRYASQLLLLQCDVSVNEDQAKAFEAHKRRWGQLDFALLNAGIAERGDIFGSSDTAAWQKTLDVDLRAVLVGTQLAVQAMQSSGRGGTILSVASAAGIYTDGTVPVYSTAKGGVVHFTRCAAPDLARRGIHLATVCPQFVDTQLVASLPESTRANIARRYGPTLQRSAVVREIVRLADDRSRSGAAVVLLQNGHVFDWNPVHQRAKPPTTPPAARSTAGQAPRSRALPSAAATPLAAPPAIPATSRAWQVEQLSRNFTEAARLVALPIPVQLPEGSVLVKRLITGVNASDVNFTSGKYHGSEAAARAQLPFTAGFESVGIVAKAAPSSGLRVGQPVASLTYGGFSEFAVEPAKHLIPVPAATAAVVTFLTSGLTASIALQEARPQPGETALVTAAAGGTGLFAVQLAKLAGMHVIGTCGSDEKGALLRQLGVDRVVNYRTEDLKAVLRAEYGKGVDVVYEGVGGGMFKTAVDALAPRGRLLIIGMMSQYGDGWPVDSHPGLPEKLLKKSASLIGFFLPSHASKYKKHLQQLMQLHDQGKLKVVLDTQHFIGVEAVPQAVQRLQSGGSVGKVVVYIDKQAAPKRHSKL